MNWRIALVPLLLMRRLPMKYFKRFGKHVPKTQTQWRIQNGFMIDYLCWVMTQG